MKSTTFHLDKKELYTLNDISNSRCSHITDVFLESHIPKLFDLWPYEPYKERTLHHDHLHHLHHRPHQGHHVVPATQASIHDSTGLGPAPRWEGENLLRKYCMIKRLATCVFEKNDDRQKGVDFILVVSPFFACISYLSWWSWLAKIPLFWEQVFYPLRRKDEQNWKDGLGFLQILRRENDHDLGCSDDAIKNHLDDDLLTEEEEVGGRVANELDERFPHHLQCNLLPPQWPHHDEYKYYVMSWWQRSWP